MSGRNYKRVIAEVDGKTDVTINLVLTIKVEGNGISLDVEPQTNEVAKPKVKSKENMDKIDLMVPELHIEPIDFGLKAIE